MKRHLFIKFLIPVLALVPLVSVVPAQAATCAENSREVEQIVHDTGDSYPIIPLCNGINGISLRSRRVWNQHTHQYEEYREIHATLQLSGHTVSGNIHVGENVYLTIIGPGTVTGTLSADSASRITVTGGIYHHDPSAYVHDPNLAAYRDGNVWKVEPKLTENNVTATPETVIIRQGDTATITAGKPTGSTTSFAFGATDSSIASVDTNGVVTGEAVGNSTITVTPSYDSNIVKVVNVKVLPKLTKVNAANVTVRVGKDNTIVPTVEDASITGATFTYTSADENVATVDENGLVTGVSAGVVNITITATYTDELGAQTVSTTITASVFDIQAGEKDNDEIAANTARDIVDQGLPENMTDASDEVKEAFGSDYETTGNNLKGAMNSGKIITTRVNVVESTDEHAKTRIDEALAGVNVAGISYYDVTVVMEAGDRIGLLRKLNNKITVALAAYEEPAAGYTRKYYVVAYHEGDDFAQILTEGIDYKIENGEIKIMSDRFSTFAVAYEDTEIPVVTPTEETAADNAAAPASPNTGFVTYEDKKSATSNNVAMLYVIILAINLIGLAGAIKSSKLN